MVFILNLQYNINTYIINNSYIMKVLKMIFVDIPNGKLSLMGLIAFHKPKDYHLKARG
jgi:hypothetical protein